MPVIKKTFSHSLESNVLKPYYLQTAGGYVELFNCYPTATLQFYDDLVSMLDEINESGLLSDEDLIKHYKYSYFRSNSNSYGMVSTSNAYWNNDISLIYCSDEDLLPLSTFPGAYNRNSSYLIYNNIDKSYYRPYYNDIIRNAIYYVYTKSAPIITIFGVPFYLFCDSLYTICVSYELNKNSVRPHFAPVYGYNNYKNFSLQYRKANNINGNVCNYSSYDNDDISTGYNSIASYQNILKLEYTIIIQYNTDYINISIKIPPGNVYNKSYYNKGIINLGLFVKGKSKITEEDIVFACANPNLYNSCFTPSAKILYPNNYGKSGCKKTIYNYDVTGNTIPNYITSSNVINTDTSSTAEKNYNYLFQKNGFLDTKYSLCKSFNITDPNLILLQNPICCFGLIEFSDNFKTGPTLYQINPCEYYEINNETYYVPSTCCGFSTSYCAANYNNVVWAAYLLKL